MEPDQLLPAKKIWPRPLDVEQTLRLPIGEGVGGDPTGLHDFIRGIDQILVKTSTFVGVAHLRAPFTVALRR